MKKGHFHEKALYRAAYGAVLACVGLFTPFFGISVVSWRNILVLLVTLALSVGISLLTARGKVICLLMAVICLGVPIAIIEPGTSYLFLRAYYQWCLGVGDSPEQWLESFRLMQTVLVTATAFLIQLLTEQFRLLKKILAFVFADVMLFCMLAKIAMTHMGVVFLLLYIAAVYVEWLQEHWKRSQSGGLRAQMLWLSPFLVVYLLLMVVMPAPETPYNWLWARNIYNRVKESFLVVSQNLFHGGSEDFSTSLSGFSDGGDLGEGIREDDREVMSIQAQSNLESNVYLIGKVYDTFDGRQWLQESASDEEERFIDTLETIYAVRLLDNKYFKDYLKEAYLRIRYGVFHTGYVFAPLKAASITGSESDLNYFFESGDLRLKERQGYGTEYNVMYYQLNLGEELFGRLLGARPELSDPQAELPDSQAELLDPQAELLGAQAGLLEPQTEPDENLWEAVANEYQRQTGHKITLEMMEAHRQLIYESFLDEVTLSEEAGRYLSEITDGAQTDLERLQAIERELNTYTYTRTPGNLPEKVTSAGEFLDYFLLERKQGYCTYFATAFVLLARAEGIPARYVQGFCVPMAGSQEATVLSSMAHSWPEVYMENVGWVPFEPTPGYENMRYTPWSVSIRDNLSSDEMDGGESEKLPGNMLAGLKGEEEKEENTEDVDQGSEDAPGPNWIGRVLLLGIPAILAGFALVLVLDNILGRYRYQRMGTAEKLKTEIRRNLRVLSWLGPRRGEQETLQELGERGMRIPGMTSLHFIEIYEDVLYGGKTAGEEMLEEVGEEREQLFAMLRKEKKRTYIFYRMWMYLVRYR